MRKINITVEAIVRLPVKVKLDLLVRADEGANLEYVLKQFGRGVPRTAKADVEDVSVESAEFQGLLDAEESLDSQVGEFIELGGKVEVISSEVTDSR